MEKFFTWVAVIALFAALGFSGAMQDGHRNRQRFEQESLDERAWRVNVATVCTIVAVLSGLIAWALSRGAA